MSPWVAIGIAIATVLASTFGSYIGFRIQFERFLARDTEREKHWDRWRAGVTSDVEQLKAERNFHVRIQQCETLIDELRDWKHEKADPHIRELGALNERVTRLEKRS